MSEENKPIDISKDSQYTSIFESNIDTATVTTLCDFFQYKIANSSDSPLSLKLDTILSDGQKDELFDRLLSSAGIQKDDILFSSMLRNKIKEIRSMELSDTTLKCDRIKGFFHQKNPSKSGIKQHQIDAMFKHIRDSFAHGRIAFDGSFVILEDKVNEMTGRLVITPFALMNWRDTIEKYLAEAKGMENNNGNI